MDNNLEDQMFVPEDVANHDPEAVRDAVALEKCRMLSEVPGLEVEFDPYEAELAGAFPEDALSSQDAAEAVFDENPLA